MSIVVADNFQYKGGKPIDARMKFASIANMVATPAADLYDGCFAYVTATKKYYSYDSSNTIDPTLSKWREFSAGEEYSDFTGATSQAAGAHGLVPAPTTGDISKFLKGDGTWATVPMPSFDYSNTSPEAMNFSTDEKVIGTWIDGKPLYQKTFTNLTTISAGTLLTLSSDIIIVNVYGVTEHGIFLNSYNGENTYFIFTCGNNVAHSIYMKCGSGYVGVSCYITIQYTKTTDTAVASGEKIVGQWIDGKPLYQKTYTGTLPSDSESEQFVNTGLSIDTVVDINAIAKSSGSQWKDINNFSVSFASPRTGGIWVGVNSNTANSNKNCIRIRQNTGWAGGTYYITLRYTKTT